MRLATKPLYWQVQVEALPALAPIQRSENKKRLGSL